MIRRWRAQGPPKIGCFRALVVTGENVRSQAVVAALLTVGAVSPVLAAPADAAKGESRAYEAAASPASPAAPQALDEDGLATTAKTTYSVDPKAGAIHVTVEVTVTNEIPNRNNGGVVEQAYFSEIGFPVLAEAANFHATKSGGGQVAVTPRDMGNPYVRAAVVDLEPNLFYGQTQMTKVTYDLPNQKPRAKGISRANAAFVTFPAFTFGDPGQTSVTVRVPSNYDVEVVGDELKDSTSGNVKVFTAENIEEPDVFMAVIVGTDDSKLTSKPADADGAKAKVRAWPDDAAWATFAVKQFEQAKPVLEELIGQPWPREDDELEIIETSSPYAYGYAGWYSEADHKISVGDELNPRVMVHELSHVWFNSQLFADRWIAEGFAEAYATTALDQLDQPQDAPKAPNIHAPGAVALNDWSDPLLLDDNSAATEKFGYSTAWYVVDQLVRELGADKLREVLDAASARTIAYTGDPKPEGVAGATDWKRLLDLLEERAGSKKAAALWETYVVADNETPTLEARTDARADYEALREDGGSWTPPLEVRTVMASWEFNGLAEAISEAEQVLDLRHDIDEALLGHDVGGLELEQQYESARDTGKVVPVAEKTLDAAKAYAEADDDLDDGAGFLGAVGLLGSGADDELDTARKELKQGHPAASLAASRVVEKRVRDAKRNGALRVGVVVLVLFVALFGWWRLRRWRRRRGDARVAKAVAALEEANTPPTKPTPTTESTSTESTLPESTNATDSKGTTDTADPGRRRLRRRLRRRPAETSASADTSTSADSTPPTRSTPSTDSTRSADSTDSTGSGRSSGFVTLGSFRDSAGKPHDPTNAPATGRRRLRRRRAEASSSADSTRSTRSSGFVTLGAFSDSAERPAGKPAAPKGADELSIPTSRFRRRRRQAEIVDPADIFGEGPMRDRDEGEDEDEKPPDRTW